MPLRTERTGERLELRGWKQQQVRRNCIMSFIICTLRQTVSRNIKSRNVEGMEEKNAYKLSVENQLQHLHVDWRTTLKFILKNARRWTGPMWLKVCTKGSTKHGYEPSGSIHWEQLFDCMTNDGFWEKKGICFMELAELLEHNADTDAFLQTGEKGN